ncbi:hypothetical protein A8C56_10770 [Niabella ginsenosidivorans]|uniref:Uncharacterized protein n=2 Tax=Niabella ginsenosidivorans TaxID=1176587 RepID=A0A1A9I1J8_9BACT|nr:hypothetical protein A8C56_10770 [Niabella ginsenosidivorans]
MLFLALLLIIACNKKTKTETEDLYLPEVSNKITVNTYTKVTAVTALVSDSGTKYLLGLAPHASYFYFDRSIANGEAYYKALLHSMERFKPYKFYIQEHTGAVVAIVYAAPQEAEAFYNAWER